MSITPDPPGDVLAPPADGTVAAGASTFGPYVLEVLVARDGRGELYRARDTVRRRPVAVRLVAAAGDRVFRERFLRDCAVASGLREPHVVPIHDYGEIEGRLFVDMRLLDADTLDGVLAAGPLPAGRAVVVVAQVAEALDAAHAAGIVHGGLAGADVLVAADGFVSVAGFGLAAAGPAGPGPAGARVEGGTADRAAAPTVDPDPDPDSDPGARGRAAAREEGLTAGPAVSPEVDLAALAALLRSCLGDRRVPPELAGVLAAAGGFRSAGAFAAAVARVLDPWRADAPAPAAPPAALPAAPPAAPPAAVAPPAPPPWRHLRADAPPAGLTSVPLPWRRRRWPVLAAGVVVLVVALVGVVAVVARNRGPERPAAPASISVPGYPDAMAVSPDGATLYEVAHEADGTKTLAAIDTRAHVVRSAIPVDIFTELLYPLPDGRVLFDTDGGNSTYDPRTGEVAPVPALARLRGYMAALSPDGRTAYVNGLDPGDPTFTRSGLLAIDVATGSRRWVAETARFDDGAVTPDGRTLVLLTENVIDRSVPAVTFVDLTTGAVQPLHLDIAPVGLLMSPDGTRVLLTSESEAVVVLDVGTRAPIVQTEIDKGYAGAAIGADRAYFSGFADFSSPPSYSILSTTTLLSLDLAGGTPQPLVTGLLAAPTIALAPDGRTAYLGQDNRVTFVALEGP